MRLCREEWSHQIPSGPGAWATLDAVEIGNGAMTLAEQQAIFSLYALVKTPLYIGADVVKLNGSTLAVYTNADVIAWNQDELGVPGRWIRNSSDPAGELWGGPLSVGAAAVLLNRGSTAKQSSVTWAELGLSKRPSAVRDAWTNKTTAVSEDVVWGGSVAPMSAIALTVMA